MNKRRNKDYVLDDLTKIDHVDAILKFLSAMTRDYRYEGVLAMPGKGEVRNMCDVAERLENKGREEGREEGRAEGKLEQLKDLVSKGLLDIAVAASEAGMSENEFSKLMKKY